MPFFNWLSTAATSVTQSLAPYPLITQYISYFASLGTLTGAIVNYYNNPLLNALATSTIVASSGLGLKKVGLVGGITLVDDLITSTGITQNHYLSNIGVSLGLLYSSGLMDNYSTVAQLGAHLFLSGLTASLTYFFDYDVVNPYRKATLGIYTNYKELYDLFPNEDYKSSINSFVLLTFGIQVALEVFGRHVSVKYNNDLYAWWYNITNNQVGALQNFNLIEEVSKKFFISSGLNVILNYTTHQIMQAYFLNISNSISKLIVESILTEDNIFKIVYDSNAVNLIKGIHGAASSVSHFSASNLINGIGQVYTGLLGINILTSNSPVTLLALSVLSNVIQVGRNTIFEGNRELVHKQGVIERNIDNKIYDISNNMRQIAERGGILYVKKNLIANIDALNEVQSVNSESNAEHLALSTLDDKLSYFITSWLAGYFHYIKARNILGVHLQNPHFHPDQLTDHERQLLAQETASSYNVVYGLEKLQDFLKWSHVNNNEYKVAMDKLSQIMQIIQVPSQSEFKITEHRAPYLHIEDMKIDIIDQNLINQSHPIDLPMGAIIELKGPTGVGKSTILTILKKIQSIPFIYGTGSLSYPQINGKNVDIIMITQSDYMTPQTTLLNVLAFPFQIRNSERPFIKMAAYKLLSELEGPNLHDKYSIRERLDEEQYDWSKALSGGQKKKVICASAIMQVLSHNIVELMKEYHDNIEQYEQKLNEFFDKPSNITPHIIQVDELLNGLDSESALYMMRAIRKYFHNSLVIVVDHTSREHNDIMLKEDGVEFFDAHLLIQNKDFYLKKFNSDKDFIVSEFTSPYSQEVLYQEDQNELCPNLSPNLMQDYCYSV